MPFGFDPHETENYINEVKETVKRIYVEVVVKWLPDGKMLPLSFTWDDGKEYKVDKVLSVRDGHSLKSFSSGKRYYCQTGKRRYYLHFDGERWYVESKGQPV